jgi:hypothetical protein
MSVRTRFAEDVAKDYEEIRDNLIAAAKGATKETYVTCQHCSRRTPAQVPDIANAVKAAQLLLEQGFGRPPQESSTSNSVQELAKRGREQFGLEQMTDDELYALAEWERMQDPEGAKLADEQWKAFQEWWAGKQPAPTTRKGTRSVNGAAT